MAPKLSRGEAAAYSSPAFVDRIRESIASALATGRTMPEFQESQIPAIERNAQVHHELNVLLTHRNAIEQDLANLFDHVAVDGTRLDPDRGSFEDEYQALLASLETANRAMYVTYAMFLDTSPPSMGPYALSMEDIECPPSTGPDIPPCPY